MKELDDATLRMLTAKSGLPMQFVFKQIQLFEVLSKVLKASKNAGLKIVMKGGTALNNIYLTETQRFSEDADFDLYSKSEGLNKIVSIEGFETQGPWKRRNTLRYHSVYPFLGQKDCVRLEFTTNKLLKTAEPITTGTMISEITGTTLYDIPVYSFDDLVARKMNALRSRAEGKDVWDCYHAIPKTKKLKKAITAALESEKLEITAEESIQQTIEKLKNADAKNMMRITNPYIPTRLRPKDWRETVTDLIRQLELLLKK
ncbi:nucleotidyl transferase AbiEii/AbiGii toxin family protein [Candidatus Micrarchaeota archaeon]|nr:nucleotidyl transferase AbiEii/AbiGii toxin family protein [Candidatus Micrarchaeota archaeon]